MIRTPARAVMAAVASAALLVSTPALSPAVAAEPGEVEVVQLTANAMEEPLGIDDATPRLRWALEADARGVLQDAIRVLVASSPELLAEGQADLWDTGRVESSEPAVEYAGEPLQSRERYYWTVQVWDDEGNASEYSEPEWFETALLSDDEWQGTWISGPERSLERLTPEQGEADDAAIRAAGEFCRPPQWPAEGFFPSRVPNNQGECLEIRPAPMLRTSFEVTKPVAKARVYSSGLAYNNLRLNGVAADDRVLDPAFTDYDETVLYTTLDVTDLLQQGENVLATELGSGQYDSATRTWDWGWDKAEWRATPELRLDLYVTYEDGTEEVVSSDPETWRVSLDGPTRYDSYYVGETYDARQEIPGWDEPGFDASAWQTAQASEPPEGDLRAQVVEPTRVVDVRDAGVRTEPMPGVFVYDVGQNLAGWATIEVDAPAGTPIQVFYTEKLEENGTASNEPGFALIGGQFQTDFYVAKGTGDEEWTPRFTYKGFRYIQVSGPNGELLPEGVEVSVEQVQQVRTAFDDTSTFETSNELINQIHENTDWAIQENVVSGIVTDTPIYEKNAWTGDAQLIAGTMSALYDTERLYLKQIQDLLDSQTDEGEIPHLVPSNENYGYVGQPAFKPEDCCGATPPWDAILFVVPWEAYQRFGNLEYLEVTYPAMQAYLDNWIPQWTDKDGDEFDHTLTSGLGDWDPPEGTPTNISLSATAYYAHFAQIAAEAARALGKPEDAARYEELFEEIRADFNAKYLREDGVYRDVPEDPFTQTAQILPLAFDLVPEDLREDLAATLANDIVENRGGNEYVGVLGARYILPVLIEAGYEDVAYGVVTQTDYPSYGYWIEELGWTALGEFWEEDSRSRSHHFFGSVVESFYQDLVGIEPIQPGYATIEFRPRVPEHLESAAATYDSVRGTVASAWRQTESGLELDVTVPANATGVVHVPASGPVLVTESGTGRLLTAGRAPGVDLVGVEGDRVIYRVGSGSYTFAVGTAVGERLDAFLAQVEEYVEDDRLHPRVAGQLRAGVNRVSAWSDQGRLDAVAWELRRQTRTLEQNRHLVPDDEVWDYLVGEGTAILEAMLADAGHDE